MAEGQTTFVDTNVLAYAYDRSETRKQPVAQARLEVLWRDRNAIRSRSGTPSSLRRPGAPVQPAF